jgi:prophage regulatory protein
MMISHATPSAPSPSPSTSQDRILRPRELASYVGLSLATLWRLRRSGSLPEPIRLSPGCVGWRTSVVDRWLAERAEAGR